MKQTFTCSLEQETIIKLRRAALEPPYRNKSHLVEAAILRFLEVEK